MRIVGLDTETYKEKNNKQKFLSVQAFSNNPYVRFVSFNPEDVKNLFTNRFRRSVFISANIEYDLLVLSQALDPDDFKVKIVYQGSTPVHGIIFRKNTERWRVIDLFNLFPYMSLKQIGELIGIGKLERPDYLGQRKPKNDEMDYFVNYALTDAEITYKAGLFFFNTFGIMRKTLGGISLGLFTQNNKWVYKLHWYDKEINLKCYEAYKGGRCEAFIRGKIPKRLFEHDVKSMYPSVMAFENYPHPFIKPLEKTEVNLDCEGVAKVRIYQDCFIPPLGIKKEVIETDSFNQTYKVKKLIFPNGVFEGVFTYPELRYLEQNGYGKILNVIWAYEIQSSLPIFKDYMLGLFSKRLQAEKERSLEGAVKSYLFKIVMNSLYGKFGELRKPDTWVLISGIGVREKKKYDEVKPTSHTNFIIASYITAYARLKLHEYYKRFGFENVYYTDTDSILSDRKLEFNPNELGGLKYEGTSDFCFIFRPKFYILGNQIVCRGFELKSDAISILTQLRKGKTVITLPKIMRLREGLRRHIDPLSPYNKPFSFNLNPDSKREWLKGLRGTNVLIDFENSNPKVIN